MAIYYVDPLNGNNSNNGTSWALAKKTIDAATTGLVAGDIVKVAKSPDPVNTGLTGTWTADNGTVTIDRPVTLTIDNCESGWTGSGISHDTSAKQGTNALYFYRSGAISTPTKLGYKTLSSTLDLSAYQQVSFWFNMATFGISSTNRLRLCLCSDSTGDVIVNDLALPDIPSGAGYWIPVVIDAGLALSSGINSVALYVNATPSSASFRIDNIIACKAPSASDCITLQTLISKNDSAKGGNDAWYGIRWIDGTSIGLDYYANSFSSVQYKYGGATESLPLYRRESTKTVVATSNTTFVQQLQTSGTYALQNKITFGWNTTTNVQDGMTIFDGLNSLGYGLYGNNKQCWDIGTGDDVSFVRYYYGLRPSSGKNYVKFNVNLFACTNNYEGIYLGGALCSHKIKFNVSNGSGAILADFGTVT